MPKKKTRVIMGQKLKWGGYMGFNSLPGCDITYTDIGSYTIVDSNVLNNKLESSNILDENLNINRELRVSKNINDIKLVKKKQTKENHKCYINMKK